MFDSNNNSNKSARTLLHRGPKERLLTRYRNLGKKHANTWRTTRLLSVGGKVLCYKYCRSPLSFKRKTCIAFQTTEMAGQVFSSCARNWKQCERFSLNGDRAWPGLTLKFKPWSELAFHVLFLIRYMQGSPAQDRGIIHFFPVILRCVQGTTQPQTFLLSLLVIQNLHLAVFDYECFLWLFCGSCSKYSKQFKNT